MVYIGKYFDSTDMNEYIFYTHEGFTQTPDGNDIKLTNYFINNNLMNIQVGSEILNNKTGS